MLKSTCYFPCLNSAQQSGQEPEAHLKPESGPLLFKLHDFWCLLNGSCKPLLWHSSTEFWSGNLRGPVSKRQLKCLELHNIAEVPPLPKPPVPRVYARLLMCMHCEHLPDIRRKGFLDWTGNQPLLIRCMGQPRDQVCLSHDAMPESCIATVYS